MLEQLTINPNVPQVLRLPCQNGPETNYLVRDHRLPNDHSSGSSPLQHCPLFFFPCFTPLSLPEAQNCITQEGGTCPLLLLLLAAALEERPFTIPTFAFAYGVCIPAQQRLNELLRRIIAFALQRRTGVLMNFQMNTHYITAGRLPVNFEMDITLHLRTYHSHTSFRNQNVAFNINSHATSYVMIK